MSGFICLECRVGVWNGGRRDWREVGVILLEVKNVFLIIFNIFES